MQEIFITREFHAPRELVFKVCTDQEIYFKLIGPENLVNVSL